MKYKYFYICFLALFVIFCGVTFTFALSDQRDNDAPWWHMSVPQMVIMNDFSDLEIELQGLGTTQKRLETMSDLLLNQSESAEAFRAQNEEKIRNIRKMTKDIERNIGETLEEKSAVAHEINLLDNEIAMLQKKQTETINFLKKIYRQAYVEGVINQGEINLHDIVFGETLENKPFMSTNMNALLETTTNNLLSRQKAIEENLTTIKTERENKLIAKDALIRRLEEYQNELVDSEKIERNLMDDNIAHMKNLEKSISQVAKSRAQIRAQIEKKKIENKSKITKKFDDIKKTLEKKLSQYNCSKDTTTICEWVDEYISREKIAFQENKLVDTFVWPVDPVDGFGYHFRDQKYFTLNNIHHEGLDILVEEGKPVRALADGYILIKQKPSKTSPGLVIVKHPSNLMSVYIGIEPNSKPMFTSVTAGDEIGTTREFREHSQKNNIHIELYERTELIDVMEKLDTKDLSPQIIPMRYGWKYIDDLKKAERTVDIESLRKTIGFFYVAGNSEPERQSTLLASKATGPYKERSMWVQESLPESVDPTFVICVAYAESHLGQYLTTKDNIGNVGNTDDGGRTEYSDPSSGIRAISAVVNNNWLGKYMTIDQLSGWGNNKGPIYASSQTNWHENVTKCMSAIKGKYVAHKSSFRLSRAAQLLYRREGFAIDENN